jgi:hypothetical protein
VERKKEKGEGKKLGTPQIKMHLQTELQVHVL